MYEIHVIGNLVRDPQRGQNYDVVNFDVAVNRRLRDGQTSTEYVHCGAWGKLGEICEKYLTKGMKVYLNGRPSARAYEGRDGSKRASLDMTVESMEMLTSKHEMEERRAAADAEEASAQTDFTEVDDGELPF